LAAELQLRSCPLCGHDYGSTAEVLEHINAATSQPDDYELKSLNLTRSVEEIRSQLTSSQREVASLKELLRSNANDRELLSSQGNNLSAEAAALTSDGAEPLSEKDVSTLHEMIRSDEERLAASLTSLAEKQLEAETRETEASNAREQLATLRSRAAALTTDGVTLPGKNELEILRHDLEQAQQRRSSHETEKTQAEQEYKERSVTCEQLSARLQVARTSLDEARARFAEHRQRLASLEQQLRERTTRLSLGSETNKLAVAITDRYAALAAVERDLRGAISDLEGIVSADRYEIAATEIKQLRSKDTEAEEEIRRISRAETRFARIAEVSRDRSRAEAEKAIEIFRDAIQECFSALYPHRHLVEIKLSAAEILVTDTDLTDAVQPYLYTSTGQLNVLALSVFIGVALRQRISKLNFVMLDEPVQNLADVQFLAFLSFVKRVALGRQVILSTADSNIAELFRRQMASSAWSRQPGRYVHYEWLGFDAKAGPDIRLLDASDESILFQKAGRLASEKSK
jgi:DNA repair exonuclease SbcCD ATPase subunit